MSSALLVLVSVGLSVGICLAVMPGADPASMTNPAFNPQSLEQLEQRIAALEQRAPIRTANPAPDARPERKPIDRTKSELDLRSLEKRIAKLEISTATLPAELPNFNDFNSIVSPFYNPEDKLEVAKASHRIAAARQVILDRTATVEEKINAHNSLRRVANAYNPQMAHEMIQIGLHNEQDTIRARVWTTFDGDSAKHLPVLVPHLIDAVNNDRSAHVRKEAAETLGNFPNDASAIAALERIAKNDPDESVRNRAQRTLDEIQNERRANRRR